MCIHRSEKCADTGSNDCCRAQVVLFENFKNTQMRKTTATAAAQGEDKAV